MTTFVSFGSHSSRSWLTPSSATQICWSWVRDSFGSHSSRSWLPCSSEAQIFRVEFETHSSHSWLHSLHSGVIHFVCDSFLYSPAILESSSRLFWESLVAFVTDSFICNPDMLELTSRLILKSFISFVTDSFPHSPDIQSRVRDSFISFVTLSSYSCLIQFKEQSITGASRFATISSHSWLINVIWHLFEWEVTYRRCFSICVTTSSHSWLLNLIRDYIVSWD